MNFLDDDQGNKKTIRIKLWVRLLAALGYGGASLALVVFFSIIIFQLTDEQAKYDSFAVAILLICLCLVLAVVVVLIYKAVSMWVYKLELTSTGIQQTILYHPFLHPFKHPYEDVLAVEKGKHRGIIRIIPQTGKPLQLNNTVEGGVDGLLRELTKYIPPEHIKIDLAASLNMPTRLDYRNLCFGLFFLISLVFIGFAPSFLEGIRTSLAWTRFQSSASLQYFRVFSMDTDVSIWVVSADIPDYRVEHHKPTGEITSWDYVNTAHHGKWPEAIARDADRHPWILWSDDQISFWNGRAWIETPFPGGTIWLDEVVTLGSQIWAITFPSPGVEQVLYYMDISSDRSEIIPLPDSGTTSGGQATPDEIRLLRDGSILVYSPISDSSNQARIDLLKNDRWTGPGCLVDLPAGSEISGFTLSPDHALWVISEYDNHLINLGTYDPTGEDWRWIQYDGLAASKSKEVHIRDFVIDELGRFWVMGLERGRGGAAYFTSVLEATPGGTVNEIVRYTTKNSAYDAGLVASRFRMDPSGKLWVDYDSLVWIDSSAAELPSPLPACLAWMTGIEGYMYLCCALIPLLFLTGITILLGSRKETGQVSVKTSLKTTFLIAIWPLLAVLACVLVTTIDFRTPTTILLPTPTSTLLPSPTPTQTPLLTPTSTAAPVVTVAPSATPANIVITTPAVELPEECDASSAGGDEATDFLPCSDFTFSTDNRYLGFFFGPEACGRGIIIMNAITGEIIYRSNVGGGLGFEFLTNGKIFISTGRCEGGQVNLLDPETREMHYLGELGIGVENNIWNDEHTAVAVSTTPYQGVMGAIWGYNVALNFLFLPQPETLQRDNHAIWSPDGSYILYQHRIVTQTVNEMGLTYLFSEASQIIKVDAQNGEKQVLLDDPHYDYFFCAGASNWCDEWDGDWVQVRRFPFEAQSVLSTPDMYQDPTVTCLLYGIDCAEPPTLLALNWRTGELLPWPVTTSTPDP